MKNITRFFLSVLLIGVVLVHQPGAASASNGYSVVNGYFTGAPTDPGAVYLCEVLGKLMPGYSQSQCYTGAGISHQYDSELVNYSALCPTNDSNCLKANLINYMAKLLDAPVPDDEIENTGAAYIVNTMRGSNAGRSFNSSSAVFTDWKARVNSPNVLARLQSFTFTVNTAFDPKTNDVVQYSEPSAMTADVLMFYYKDASGAWQAGYAIKLDCGNPVGGLGPLPQPDPPTFVQCGGWTVNANPRPEVGQPISITATPTFSGGPPTPVVQGPTIHVTGPGFDSIWSTPPASVPPGPGGGTLVMNSPQFTPTQAGVYVVSWNLLVNGVGPVPAPCGGTFGTSFEVMNYPFIEVKGGDISAGSGIITDPSQTCGTPVNNTNAGVVSWNRNSGAYTGAGGQYATFAWNFIQEFNTAKGSGRPPSYLSFSNQTATGQVNLPAGRYGGFGRPATCIDHWKDAPATIRAVPSPAGVNLNTLDGIYSHTGNLTINASTLSAGKKVTIYVSGNVRIAGDIVYGGANSTWADTTQIPMFKLVAKGTIHITNTVNRIDGTYVAVPDTPGYTAFLNSYAAPRAGTISTCSSNVGYAVLNPAAGAAMINACNRRLEVNGSLAANQIFFLRTWRTMSSGEPAEVINFNPETWLAPAGSKGIDPTYQSIVGLPPVL